MRLPRGSSDNITERIIVHLCEYAMPLIEKDYIERPGNVINDALFLAYKEDVNPALHAAIYYIAGRLKFKSKEYHSAAEMLSKSIEQYISSEALNLRAKAYAGIYQNEIQFHDLSPEHKAKCDTIYDNMRADEQSASTAKPFPLTYPPLT